MQINNLLYNFVSKGKICEERFCDVLNRWKNMCCLLLAKQPNKLQNSFDVKGRQIILFLNLIVVI